jgi:hypothetical protein
MSNHQLYNHQGILQFSISAKKEFYFLEDAGHGLLETNYDWFQQTVIQKILPNRN